ncbi:alpha/beta hydrolase [Agrilactobacillus fermenti]|uniref:alpha/beta hydrolase n=1 Tax=Agrilactobacillus fermenti TaxID=2586909 RepID=UPI001E29C5C1|nr:alpha/beta hydrolase family protein [Agrilactobacillus fermenti]MCD2256820.1 prolyl oligopeptidase family serine peptidase [Agrilactobacillus fermenti]
MKEILLFMLCAGILTGLTGCGSAHSQNQSSPKVASSKASRQAQQRSKPKTTANSKKSASTNAKPQQTLKPKGTTPARQASMIEALSMWSPTLQRNWPYAVYTPSHYDPTQRYPVIYLLHGIDGDYTNFYKLVDSKSILDQVEQRDQQSAIVVFVQGDNSFYIDSDQAKMATAITQELPQQLDRQYAIAAGAKNRAIGGISMGGYGAMSLAFQHTDQFSLAFGISPAVWYQVPAGFQAPGRVPVFSDSNGNWSQEKWQQAFPTQFLKQASGHVKIMLASSKQDTTVPVANVVRFADETKAAGVDTTLELDNFGGHTFPYWGQVLPNAYSWTLQQFKHQGG